MANKTTTSTKTKAGKIPTSKDNAKKPEDMKTIVPEKKTPAAGQTASAEEATGVPGATVGKSPTAPDEVTESAQLGGSTVEEIKEAGSTEGDAEPAREVAQDDYGLRVNPRHMNGKLLVGNTYTFSIEAHGDDDVTFQHPTGREIPAAVTGGRASGTILVERPGTYNVAFKVNGKKVASGQYDTFTG